MKKTIISTFLLIFATLVFLGPACTAGGEEAPAVQKTAVEETAENSPEDEPEPEPTTVPTQSDPAQMLDEQPYQSQTGAYSLFFPHSWNCSESGSYRTDCQSPDGAGTIIVRATHTGYELMQVDFERFAKADLTYLYGDKRAYDETETESSEGKYISRASWQEAGVPWQSIDYFYRRDYAVYQVSFAAVQERWEDYGPLFEAVRERAAFSPVGVASAPLYAFRKEYTDPGVFYTLEVPTSWTKYIDVGSIERTRLELFESPDRHARIDAALYQQSSTLDAAAKAEWARMIINRSYGRNARLSISSDKHLPDGRELLVWQVESRGLSGWSYFDSFGGSLFVLSFLWDNSTALLYESLLIEDIGETFKLK